MTTESVGLLVDPIASVENALLEILRKKKELGLSIIGYIKAPARLMRQGVTFLVTVQESVSGETDEVPIRVEDEKIVYYRFVTQEQRKWWRRKYIHAIQTNVYKNSAKLMRKIVSCLKSAINHFAHKIQRITHRHNLISAKKAHDREKRSFHRPDQCRMHH